MKARAEESASRPGAMVSMANIAIVVIAFGIGFVIALFLQNFLAKQDITLTTQQLILLVFTVAVGAASVILAVVAIVISRKAEESLTRRSEEGIRLQNEVFLRTNEVLSKIQTSTGLTEKRLEDMVSGRTAVIAREVVERSLPKREAIVTKEIADKIRNDLAQSLKEELLPLITYPPSKAEKILAEKEAKQTKSEDISERWRIFKDSIIHEIKKCPDVNVVSEAEGVFGAENASEFWDTLLEIKNRRVGIAVFTREQIDQGSYKSWRTVPSDRLDAVRQLTWRIQQDDVALAFVVFDEDVWEQNGLAEIARLLDEFSLRDSKSEIIRLAGHPNSLANEIYSMCTASE